MDPLPSPLPSHVTVLGQGNVALDIARILLSDPSRLEPYDLPAHVIAALKESQVKHVTVLGRRGPAQASFTAKELREMMRLPNVAFEPVRPEVLAELDGVKLERQHKRVLDIMKKGSEAQKGDPGVTRSWNLEFWRAPTGVQIKDTEASPRNDQTIELEVAHTVYAASEDGSKKLVQTGETSTLHTSLLVTSLGQKCTPDTTPFCDPSAGHIRTAGGSFTNPELNIASSPTSPSAATNVAGDTANTSTTAETSTTGPVEEETEELGAQDAKSPVYGQVLVPRSEADGEFVPLPNVYAAGWAARGAKGVLGTTMLDAHAVGESIVGEWLGQSEGTEPSVGVKSLAAQLRDAYPQVALDTEIIEVGFEDLPEVVDAALKSGEGQPRITTYDDWLAIDAEEVKRGEQRGKERERLTWAEAQVLLNSRKSPSS